MPILHNDSFTKTKEKERPTYLEIPYTRDTRQKQQQKRI